MDGFFLNQTWHAGTSSVEVVVGISSLGDVPARHETDDRRVHWDFFYDHLTDKRMGIAALVS